VLLAVATEFERLGGSKYALSQLLPPGSNPGTTSKSGVAVSRTLSDMVAKWRRDLGAEAMRTAPRQHVPAPPPSGARLPFAAAGRSDAAGPTLPKDNDNDAVGTAQLSGAECRAQEAEAIIDAGRLERHRATTRVRLRLLSLRERLLTHALVTGHPPPPSTDTRRATAGHHVC
jgi:hypothetical protein